MKSPKKGTDLLYKPYIHLLVVLSMGLIDDTK